MLNILAPYFSKTAGSGSVFKDGDLRNHEIVCEVKVRGTAGASIASKDLAKLKREAKKEGKDWLFICENSKKNLIAMIGVYHFSYLYESSLVFEKLFKYDKELCKRLLSEVQLSKGRI